MITLIFVLEIIRVYPSTNLPTTEPPTGYPFIRYNVVFAYFISNGSSLKVSLLDLIF